MFEGIGQMFKVLASRRPATEEEIQAMRDRFGAVPTDYLELAAQATNIEIEHVSGQPIRIWDPQGLLDMDSGYGVRKYMPGAIPVGTDSGGRVIIYADANEGYGLYFVDYGVFDLEEATWIAPSLGDFLMTGQNVELFGQ